MIVSIDQNGNLWGMGSNSYGQLGVKSDMSKFTKYEFPVKDKIKNFSCGKYHVLALTDTGKVYAIGKNESGMIFLTINFLLNYFNFFIF